MGLALLNYACELYSSTVGLKNLYRKHMTSKFLDTIQ